MKRRMVCIHDLSKAIVCQKKFFVRREFNNHVEEHKAQFKAKTLSRIRSTLLLNQKGLLLDAFQKEFKSLVGQNVPYKAHGFNSTYDFLLSIPDVVEVQVLPTSQAILLIGVPDVNTQDMARMVSA